MARERETVRTCIVTRQERAPEDLIRFVAGPDGTAVPDLKGDLPGRGAWVTATRSCLLQAAKRQAFTRALKEEAKADGAMLAPLVERLLKQRALGALGLARKAGQMVSGFAKVEAALKSGKAVALIGASDGSPDGLEKLARIATKAVPNADQITARYSADDLGLALGLENVIHAALLAGAAAEGFLRCDRRYRRFIDDSWTLEPMDGTKIPAIETDQGQGPKDDVTTE